jgi:hypothetical protein
MAGLLRFKVFIEGIRVPVSTISRTQVEGEPGRLIIEIWPTNVSSRIRRGSWVTVFRFEDNRTVLLKNDKNFDKYEVDGAWELFFDGYVDKEPTVSKRTMQNTVLMCVQWAKRMDMSYIRATSLSIEDMLAFRDRAFMGIRPTAIKYFSASEGDPFTNALTVIKDRIVKQSNNIGDGILSLVPEATSYDELFARIVGLTQLNKRMLCAENVNMVEFLNEQGLINVLTNQVETMPSQTTLFMIINQLMYQVLYTATMVCSPYYNKSKKLNEVIFKPQVFFATPIKCNAIFPGSVQAIQPTTAGQDRATRMAVIGYDHIQGAKYNEIFTVKRFYPDAIGKNINIDMDISAYGNLPLNEIYTADELIEERIVPAVTNMPFSEAIMREHAIGTKEKSLAERYGRYTFHLEENISHSLGINMDFDPYLICGLSAVVFDEQLGYILGRIRTIGDTIDLGNSVAGTFIELTNVRIVHSGSKDSELQIKDYSDLFGRNGFFSDDFKNDNIGKKLYEKFFGSTALYDTTVTANPIGTALRKLYSQYKKVPGESVEEFIKLTKYRPVITEKEFMVDFIGAEPEKVDSLSKELERYATYKAYKSQYASTDRGVKSKPFMKERQDIILEYIKDIGDDYLAKIG